jgi:hypothetical protein
MCPVPWDAATPPSPESGLRTFLALMKDADPDISIMKEAKTEYAKMQ